MGTHAHTPTPFGHPKWIYPHYLRSDPTALTSNELPNHLCGTRPHATPRLAYDGTGGAVDARDALIVAILPAPGGGMPAWEDVDRAGFWPRFDAAAPLHVRAALTLVAFLLVRLGPWWTGAGRRWRDLDDAARDALLRRAAGWPGMSDLLEVAKVTACFAYFDDARVQAILRGRDP